MDLDWSTQVTFVRVMGQIGENSFLLPVGGLNTKCYHSVLVRLQLSWWQSFYTTNILLSSLCNCLWVLGFSKGRRGIVWAWAVGLLFSVLFCFVFCSGGRGHATFYYYPSHPLVSGIFFNSLLTAASRTAALDNLSTECKHQSSLIKLKLKCS